MRHHSPARRFFAFGMLAMFAGFLFVAVEPAYAITIVPNCARASSLQTPGLDCILATFRNVASLIVGLTGSFALLMFVYGGFMMLTSGGVESKVTKGKEILKNAIIGIVLVFTAGYLIDYGIHALQGTHYATVGSACNDGRGSLVDAGERGLICRTPCARMAGPDADHPIYSCQEAATATGCNADYIGCGGSQACCLTPAPEPTTPEAPPEEPPITN